MLVMKFMARSIKSSNKCLNKISIFGRINIEKKFSYKQANSKNRLDINLIKKSDAKKNNKIDPNKAEEYTTYSIYSPQETPDVSGELLKEVEKLQQKTVDPFEWPRIKYFILPVIYFPLAMHTGFGLFDQLFSYKLTHYTFQNFLKHLFLINSLHTGVLTGIKLTGVTEGFTNMNKNVLSSLAISIGAFGIVNLLVSFPLSVPVFNALYGTLLVTSFINISNFEKINPTYTKLSQIIILVCMLLMCLFVNLNFSQYQKKVQDQSKFEEVIRFYQLSSDREFKKVMDSFEEFLGEIDIKVEKY